MNYSEGIVLIKNRDRTKDIEYIRENGDICHVKFHGCEPPYDYACKNVVWIKEFSYKDIKHCRVYVKGRPEFNVAGLRKGTKGIFTYYIVVVRRKDKETDEYVNVELAFPEKDVEVRASSLRGKSRNIFEYIRHCAALSEIGKDENNPADKGILENIYAGLDYIDPESIASVYLNHIQNLKFDKAADTIIFPFGTNRSQTVAVRRALENRISVIQGPLGTGKTQTILNIVANIILQGKTVLVVSGNNSATSNIREKLGRYGLDFLVAPLGNKKNKEAFIASQTGIPLGISSWRANNKQILDRLSSKYKLLPEIFKLREDIAGYKLELSDIQMEKSHYQKEVMAKVSHVKIKGDISSRKLYEKVRILNRYAEVSSEEYLQGRWRLPSSVLRYILRLRCRYMLGQREPMTEDKLLKILSEYELLFYTMKEEELSGEIDSAERRLEEMKWDVVMDDISELSLMLFKSCLADLFSHDREIINDVRDIRRKGKDFLKDYPVVLSTTFSSRSCMGEYPLFDYVIMDEASQVSIETGVLALTCARNAVIVGDTLQLPNVVKDKDRERLRQIERRLNEIKNDFNVPDGYNCADNSFLSSVLAVIHSLPVTMLREHYRCHPDIINFCNQKFYNGELLIMTQKYGVHSPWCMITSSEGKHKIGKYNQREIDIIAREYLPSLGNHVDIGIIAPYKEQVDHIKEQLDQKDVATVHKFQGREKDVIVFSVTDDEISEFADNANLLNVAVSRARERFCLVVSGREQQRHGNIHDLMQYIRYCNGEVRKSRLNSIFDNLDRMKFTDADRNKKLSNKAEAATYKLIKEIIPDYAETHSLDCVVHYKLSNLISDYSLLEEDERRYASHPGTHLDFIIYNKLTREALMAVETDGYTYHNKKTVQHRRDIMKDGILKKYGLALIRLKTNSCEERTLITKTLDTLLSVNEVSHTHGTYLHLIEEY